MGGCIMRLLQAGHIAAALFLMFVASPAAALGSFPGHGGGGGGGSVSTPAPIAGAGLVGIGVAGAAIYMAIRRRRKPGQD